MRIKTPEGATPDTGGGDPKFSEEKIFWACRSPLPLRRIARIVTADGLIAPALPRPNNCRMLSLPDPLPMDRLAHLEALPRPRPGI